MHSTEGRWRQWYWQKDRSQTWRRQSSRCWDVCWEWPEMTGLGRSISEEQSRAEQFGLRSSRASVWPLVSSAYMTLCKLDVEGCSGIQTYFLIFKCRLQSSCSSSKFFLSPQRGDNQRRMKTNVQVWMFLPFSFIKIFIWSLFYLFVCLFFYSEWRQIFLKLEVTIVKSVHFHAFFTVLPRNRLYFINQRKWCQ